MTTASYLFGQSVRYVAYAYADEALFPATAPGKLSHDAWVQADAMRAVDFQNSLAEMMQKCPLVFKDDTRAVIHITEACLVALSEVAAEDGSPK